MTYIETPADHDFSAFLASLTPGEVLRDRSAMFSKPERKREAFLKQKRKHEARMTAAELTAARESEVYIALAMAQEMRTG